ncbi:activator-dependent family glycosyltransferase [Streptomyces sp. HU2014]|uniref:Glycosyltransferase n=1 Tax=Streptomyces albireticuli TaxID=1940 RepID=A0A1Z2KZ30_9ACTN|nr:MULTISPECIES: activator-dependent family glycosyltransferase [Streptomyces]ARZ67308.1 glycosyltransferase [Streptomyces albireticuli]UQI47355.1 activator-dependent family glycosyltransferase [Streptomyces sp. HU2014]
MRVLLTSLAHNTHFYSLVPLAWALRAAGHEVRVASPPSLTDVITSTGLTAVPVGDDQPAVELLAEMGGDLVPYQKGFEFTEHETPEETTWEYLLGQQTMMSALCFAPFNGAATMDAVVGFARDWRPDLVVWEPWTYAGPVAARACGAAHARILWGPDTIGRSRKRFLRALGEQPAELREDPLAEWLGWTLERYGCAYDERDVLGHWVIDPGARSTRLDLGQTTVPMRYVPYNGRAVIEPWLSEPPARPRVCLTLGVSARETYGRDAVSYPQLLEALGRLDIEVIATLDASQRELVGELPGNVVPVDFVPLDALLPTCSVIIHHGGAGTWSTAMLHGVPQIVVPSLWDAPIKAQQLQRLSAGFSLPPAELTAEKLADAVRAAVGDPAIRAGARRLREEMLADPAPAGIVPTLERLADAHRAVPQH